MHLELQDCHSETNIQMMKTIQGRLNLEGISSMMTDSGTPLSHVKATEIDTKSRAC